MDNDPAPHLACSFADGFAIRPNPVDRMNGLHSKSIITKKAAAMSVRRAEHFSFVDFEEKQTRRSRRKQVIVVSSLRKFRPSLSHPLDTGNEA